MFFFFSHLENSALAIPQGTPPKKNPVCLCFVVELLKIEQQNKLE